MQSILKHSLKIKNPAEGCVAYHLHGILSTNFKRGCFITYFLSRLILSNRIEKVLIVVLGAIINPCNLWWLQDMVGDTP